jgi:hypothetical protein
MEDDTLQAGTTLPNQSNEDYDGTNIESAGQSALVADAEGLREDGEDGEDDNVAAVVAPEEEEAVYDPMLVLELGDRVIIDSRQYGRTIGTIYYRSGELIRVLPDGVSDRLYDFPRIYTDDEDKFADELGVEVSYILAKRSFPAFVEQHDIRVGQRIETITKDGELGPKYSVETVDPENDTITVKDETGETQDIVFEGIGIPLDLSFVILRKEIGSPTVETAESDAIAPPAPIGEGEGEVADDEEDVLETPDEGEEFEVVGTGFIEVPKVVVYREARAADKVYTDIVQKIDALSDFMSMLDPAAQKDPRAIRVIRLLVETMFTMKYDLVDYNPDGTVKGSKPLSVDSISQLMERVNVPLARVVIDSKKRILKYKSENGDDEDDDLAAKSAAIPDRSDAPDDYYVIEFLKDLDAMNARGAAAPSSLPVGVEQGSTSPFWLQEQTFANTYMRTWEPNSVRDPVFTPKSDADVFRRYIPDFDAPQVPGGFEPDMIGMTTIAMSMQRALTTTYRKGADRRKIAHIGPEVARAKNYLLFPINVAPAIGTTRSGSLAIDSGRSHNPLQTLRDILRLLDGIQEVTTSKGILALGVAGNTIGNIPLNDYLEGIAIPGTGFGAADQTLVEYGLDQLELTPEILTLLNSKFTAYQEQLISTLARLRKEIADEATAAEGTTPEPVMKVHYAPADAPPHILEENIRSEPILVEDINAFERQNQALVSSDIALVAYLLRKHADYFQAAVGKQPVYTARERLRATRDMFIESLRITQVLRRKREEAGEPPEPNKCEHVAKLRTIRKIHDDQERYTFLTKFFAKYQGTREDNWIHCNICEKHLMCVHERIQIQAFLSPKEKDQLQKEIILNFADGVFQGNYICKNCGQPIREIGYDTSLEYDDEGRPMAGRSTLVDKDALRREEIDMALGTPVSQKEEFEFKSPTERAYFKVIFELANRVGVTMDRDAYKRVMARVKAFMSKLPSRDAYSKSMKSAGSRGAPDYDVTISRNMICASALFLLLEIQTRVPDYVVRYALPGCVASFAGYPLIANEADKRGLQYLACAVASVSRDEAPWNISGFFSVKLDKRREAVQAYMERILSAVMKDDVTIQQAIVQKLEYIRETFGSEAAMDRPMDIIPASFLPEQTVIKATDEIIIPEVAGSMNSMAAQSAVAKAWILHAHSLAKKTASLVRGSPFSETTCCMTHLQSPGTFWSSVSDMPALPPHRMDPSLLQQSTVRIHFTPRKMENLLAETPEGLMYRTFLKVCFQGPRKGLPHEAGLTNLCAWCGFQFPGHPMVIDTDTEGKTALIEQSVDTSKDAFMQLLDRVHDVNTVPNYTIPKIIGLDRTFKELAEMNPVPLDGWTELMESTLRGLKGLPADMERNDLIPVLGPLSDAIGTAKEFLNRRVKPVVRAQIDALASMSWTNFFQVLLAYFVIPYRRLLTNFDVDKVKIPKDLELGRDHEGDLMTMLQKDNAIVSVYRDDVQRDSNRLIREKLAHFLAQMTEILPFKTKIRAIMLPGRTETLQYIQQALLYGPLAELINPNITSMGASEGAGVAIADASARLILNIVSVSIAKATKERLTFNEEEIRDMIAVRKAKEEMEIVTMFANMSDDRRAAELTMKRLGIGEKWSIGGTKLVYAYDAGQYSREKAERARAGIGDDEFGIGTNEVASFAQEARTDEFGFVMESEDHRERDGGYDTAQVREDDY